MELISASSREFLGRLDAWFESRPEILMLIRYSHAGGAKSFELFSSFRDIAERLLQLPPRTSVIAFRQPQLPLRGQVDDAFVA